jgi:hypothetical protein
MNHAVEARNRADQMVNAARSRRAVRNPGGSSGGSAQIPGVESDATNRARRQYGKNTGWVYASIRPIAVRVARQPFRVGKIKERDAGEKESPESFAVKNRLPCHLKTQLSENVTVELVNKHPMLQALADPNPMMTEWALKFVTAASAQLTGWAFWWMWRADPKDPERNGTGWDIWPVPTHWVKKAEKGKGWDVTAPGESKPVFVPAEDMAVFYYPDPENPSRARGPMDASELVASASEKVTVAQSATFDNVALPTIIFRSGVVEAADGTKSLPEFTDAQKQTIEATLRQLYRGVHKWGRFLVTDKNIEDVDLLSQKPFEMDFQQSGQMLKEEIMQIFGVNPAVAGQLENSNRASATVATESFLDNVVNPLLTMMSQALNQWVLPKFLAGAVANAARELSAWIEEAIAYDPDGVRANVTTLLGSSGITVDTARFVLMGLPPLPNGWGNQILVKAGMKLQRVDQTPEEAAADEQAKIDAQNAARMAGQQGSPAAKALAGSFSSLWLKTHGFHEGELASVMRRFFQQQTASILSRVRETQGNWTPEAVFVPEDWDAKLIAAVQVPLARAGFQGAARGQLMSRKDSVDSVLTVLPTNVQAAIRQTLSQVLAEDYWAEINIKTQWKLRSLFIQMSTNGWDLTKQIAAIQQVLGVQPARAENIARTETTGMLNAGAYAVAQEMAEDPGGPRTKTWLATEDEATRDAHFAANGQTVGISELFVLFDPETGITEYAPYPGYHKLSAKQRCNCRCTPTTGTGDVGDFIDGFAA